MTEILKSFKQTLTYRAINIIINNIIDWFEILGEIGIIFTQVIGSICKANINFKRFIEQSARFGFDSLLISISMVGISGMIIALQFAQEMVKQGAGNFVGSLVSVSIVREIGPIIGSFAVISMVGSSMAAEIASMKVTDQISAMKVLRVSPIDYLITPRVLAGITMMPFVIILASFIGIVCGLIISNIVSGLSASSYINSVWQGLSEKDIWVSFLKAGIFGGIIALISSSIGYKTTGGAREVGIATTKAVVWSFVAVVIVDYIISLIFYN